MPFHELWNADSAYPIKVQRKYKLKSKKKQRKTDILSAEK